MGFGIGPIVLMVGIFILSYIVSHRFKKKFKKYSQTPLSAGYSGREVALKMLQDSGIHDVKIVEGKGMLTDHYNPASKTVSLSKEVFHGRSIASAAIAAHECGHAIQHARAYSWLQFRSAMVPVVSASSRVMPFILIGGILLLNTFPSLLLIGIGLFALTTLFSFVTLPVEYDATNRALVWLDNANITHTQEHSMARDALKAAANTYVVAALASLATLAYYVMIFLSRR